MKYQEDKCLCSLKYKLPFTFLEKSLNKLPKPTKVLTTKPIKGIITLNMGNLPSPDTREPARHSRRAFLKGAAAVVGLGAATATGINLDLAGKAGETLAYYLNTPFKKFFTFEDGKPVISKDPHPVKVKLTPLSGVSKYFNDDNIIFHEEPKTDAKEHKIASNKIKAEYAARVLGGTFPEDSGKTLTIVYNDKEYKQGYWLMLTDEKGSPVKPDGAPLDKKELPYYTAANFATVLPQTASNK